MDTIKTLAEQRHFFTVELRLRDFGNVLLIGDQAAVERISRIVSEHEEHELVDLSGRAGAASKPAPVENVGGFYSSTPR